MKRKFVFIILFPLYIFAGQPIGQLIAPTFGSFSYIGFFYLLSLILGGILWVKYFFDLIRPRIVK